MEEVMTNDGKGRFKTHADSVILIKNAACSFSKPKQ